MEKGNVLRVKINVVSKVKLNSEILRKEINFNNVEFKNKKVRRNLILVNDEENWEVLKMSCVEKDKCGRFVLKWMKMSKKMDYRKMES